MPVFLWTDLLIYFLLFSVTGYIIRVKRSEYLSAPWKKFIRRPSAMIASIILLLYLSIGLLDSIHFHQRDENGQLSTDVISAFDVMVTPVRVQTEKTYSAPFALKLYVRESVTDSAGNVTRSYPPLIYGGQHLANEDDRSQDLFSSGLRAVGLAVFFWILFMLAILSRQAKRKNIALTGLLDRILHGRTDLPWRTLLLTTLTLTILISLLITWGANYHVLGTDKVGQDVLYGTLKSIRTGLVIGTLTTLVMLPFAIVLGISAGYFRGRADDVIQFIYTTLNSIPAVLLIAASILVLQVYMSTHAASFESIEVRADMRLLFLCLILGITSWTTLCRLLRGETLKLSEIEYIQAARAFGVKDSVIIIKHILPNVMHIVLITIVLDFSALVLAEAVLSYINIGVDPVTYSWGNMINSARLELAREPIVWWSLMAAFGFMFVLVLSANLFADAVRDAFDPKTE